MNRQGLTTMELAGLVLVLIVIGAVNAHRQFMKINTSLDHETSKIHVTLNRIDGHLKSIDSNLDRMDGHLKSIDSNLDRMDGHLDSMNASLDRMDANPTWARLRWMNPTTPPN